jgi:hypothetical protein
MLLCCVSSQWPIEEVRVDLYDNHTCMHPVTMDSEGTQV